MKQEQPPKWDYKPRKLTKLERQQPIRVINDFFSYASLPQVREMYWDLWKTTVTGNYNTSLSQRERNNLIYLLEQIEKLIEATHIYYQKK